MCRDTKRQRQENEHTPVVLTVCLQHSLWDRWGDEKLSPGPCWIWQQLTRAGAASQTASAPTWGKGQEERFYGRLCHLLLKWVLWVGGYLKWSAASLNPSLGGPREILLSISFFTLGSSRKGKLQQYIRCPTGYSLGPLVTCAVPAGESELRCPCEGAIKPFTNNRKWLSWGVGVEDGVCQTSPVFTAAFYIVYVEKGL